MILSVSERIKEAIRNYLNIEIPTGLSVNIEQLMDFDADVFKNRIWYRGRANELEQLYASIDDGIGNGHFWGSKPTQGMRIRKIHTGLPGLIIDVLTDVCTDDLYSIDASDRQSDWNEIADDNDIIKVISQAVRSTLALGDGAFKLSYDPEISKYPIIEFYEADRVDFEYERRRLCAVIFKTVKVLSRKQYILKERYTKYGITYTLENSDGKEVDISSFVELQKYQPIINKAEFMAAIPLMFKESAIHKGRGKSIFDTKLDNFDSFDEIVSQWMLAVRKGQLKTYIPDVFLPRNPKSGEIIAGNDFDNDYIQIESDMAEGESKKITTTQGEIQHEALLSSYCTILDLCLQGIISPSTLGIDVKKLDNAEAQREKEKTTLYTRNKVLEVLGATVSELVTTALMFYDNLFGNAYKDVDVTVNFGGYANPSFEAQVETIGKAAQSGIMSIETQIDELYGDDKDDDWKAAEVRRIKEEKGITEADEPAINTEPSAIGLN